MQWEVMLKFEVNGMWNYWKCGQSKRLFSAEDESQWKIIKNKIIKKYSNEILMTEQFSMLFIFRFNDLLDVLLGAQLISS